MSDDGDATYDGDGQSGDDDGVESSHDDASNGDGERSHGDGACTSEHAVWQSADGTSADGANAGAFQYNDGEQNACGPSDGAANDDDHLHDDDASDDACGANLHDDDASDDACADPILQKSWISPPVCS